MHVGVSEFYLKKGAKITFSMVHNWSEQVEVRPRTGVILNDDTTYISNYILTSPREYNTDISNSILSGKI
jgi:Fe-S cluster assembly scaffold protein SufB